VHILVDLDGVLRQGEKPIFPGVVLTGTLTAYNKLTIMSATSREETQRWLDVHGIVDMDDIIDASVGLESEDLSQRQVTLARSRGSVDLLITGNPKLWVFAFEQGIPSVMFGAPEYSRVEFRPDAPKKVRSWSDIESAIDKQNALRTQDARLTRTDALQFGD
jgi:hypothetical protein